MPNIEVSGLPAFFRFMNTWAPGKWYLVGGCAAWMHIARARRDFSEGVDAYRTIFPNDIEVVIDPTCRQALLDHLAGGTLSVRVGSLGPLHVDLLGYADGGIAQRVEGCEEISGGNVLSMAEIIRAYNRSGDPSKREKREQRVAMLNCIISGVDISSANVAARKKPSLFSELISKKLVNKNNNNN